LSNWSTAAGIALPFVESHREAISLFGLDSFLEKPGIQGIHESGKECKNVKGKHGGLLLEKQIGNR